MERIEDGWFIEKNSQWPGQAMALEVEEVLHHEKTGLQDLLIFKSTTFGRVLVLDGCIQTTDRDEFSYQEMISFLPLNVHPNPKKVLIVGGGDGGVAREVAKHPCVESIVQCEIDQKVIEASKKYLPDLSIGFGNPKLKLHIGSGFEYMKQHTNEFDLIISDLSDPDGPAKLLFTSEYYALMKNALKPDGILCTQGECQWIHQKLIAEMLSFCKGMFPVSGYAFVTIPTYPSGQIGFIICSKDKNCQLDTPVHVFTEEQKTAMNLRYYDEEVHKAAFVLPRFMRKELEL